MEVHQKQCLDHEIDVLVAIKRHTSLSSGVTGSSGDCLEAELMETLATDGCAVLRIRKDTSVVQKRFGFPENSVHQFAEMGEDSSWRETAPAVRRRRLQRQLTEEVADTSVVVRWSREQTKTELQRRTLQREQDAVPYVT